MKKQTYQEELQNNAGTLINFPEASVVRPMKLMWFVTLQMRTQCFC